MFLFFSKIHGFDTGHLMLNTVRNITRVYAVGMLLNFDHLYFIKLLSHIHALIEYQFYIRSLTDQNPSLTSDLVKHLHNRQYPVDGGIVHVKKHSQSIHWSALNTISLHEIHTPEVVFISFNSPAWIYTLTATHVRVTPLTSTFTLQSHRDK